MLDETAGLLHKERFGATGAGSLGSTPPAFNAPLSNEELIIEVELVAGASALGAAQTTRAVRATAGDASAGPLPPGFTPDLENALRNAKQVFTEQQIQADETQIRTAIQGAAPGQMGTLERLPSRSRYVRLRFPPGTVADAVIEALKKLPEVNRAVVVPRTAAPGAMPAGGLPADPLIGANAAPVADPQTRLETQWYLHRTRVPQAWRYARGANVVVADIDWGFRISHQDLAPAIELTYNAVDGRSDVTQGRHAAHGTAVLGIAGARTNGVGMAGYAPEAAIWAIQGDSAPTPSQFEEPWVEAIDFVRRTDAGGRRKVIILEVQTVNGGNYEQVLTVHREIRAAISEGCVVCVAAGNGNRLAEVSDRGEPFDPTGSILVGATSYHAHENTHKRAPFSNFGKRVVISAPGDPDHDLTCGQVADNSYVNGFGGTSGAAPKVAGTVALMLSVNPGLSHNDVRDILAGTGTPIAEDPGKPVGVFLNAEAAVAEALRRSVNKPQPALPNEPQPVASQEVPQGMRRRRSRRLLPREGSSLLEWATDEEGASPPEAAELTSPLEGKPPAGDTTLQIFRNTKTGVLTQQDRILIVGQAIQMLDNFYVHRPLKEAIHAIRPIQRLRVLQRRLLRQVDIPAAEQDELTFHNTLTQIFNSFRDLHTSYQLPSPYRNYIAYLPFELAVFTENNQQHYLVTRTMPGAVFDNKKFGAGAEILYWNGMTTARAIQVNADQTAGGNEAARLARGLSALTIRPMNTALPPDADFVDIEFVLPGGDVSNPADRHRMRQYWYVRYAPDTIGSLQAAATSPAANPGGNAPQKVRTAPILFEADNAGDLGRESTVRSMDIIFEEAPPPPAPPAAPPADTTGTDGAMEQRRLEAVLGLDIAADDVREARELIFDAQLGGAAPPASPPQPTVITFADIPVQSPWNAAFRARTVEVAGVSYGYIHIRTFYVQDADGFVQEFIRLLNQLPERGLVLDVRGNGGGSIWAAERLLQTLTATEIEPERLQFITTPGTLDLTRNNPDSSAVPLHQWLPSLEEAVETGSTYSRAFPLTSKESCNNIGQKYYGPVVLVVDGNCYSATDIFAAGFQDHRIGKVLGVSATTGAGGANVWEHGLLADVLPPGWGLKPLPNGVGMRVAIRQCLRVGPRAGELLEDFGVIPDAIHQPTRADILADGQDLLVRATQLLAAEATRSLRVTVDSANSTHPGKRQLTIKTRGLTRLDFYLNGRPEKCLDLVHEENTLTPYVQAGATLRLLGYNTVSSTPVALYQAKIS